MAIAIRNAAYPAAIQAIQAGQFDRLSSTDDIPRWPRPVRDSPVTRLLSRTATKLRRPPRMCTRHQGMTVVSHRPWYERRPTTPARPRRPRTTCTAGAEGAPRGADRLRPRMSRPKALLVGHAGSPWRFVDIRLEGCATIRADERRDDQSTDAPT